MIAQPRTVVRAPWSCFNGKPGRITQTREGPLPCYVEFDEPEEASDGTPITGIWCHLSELG